MSDKGRADTALKFEGFRLGDAEAGCFYDGERVVENFLQSGGAAIGVIRLAECFGFSSTSDY